MPQSSDGSGAVGCLGFILIAVAVYYGLTTDGPSPDTPWMSYGKNIETNRIEWMLLDTFKTKDECSFAVERELRRATYYRRPAGCMYRGYQNPYVLWVINKVLAPGAWLCVAENKTREKYSDPQWAMVVNATNILENDNYKCYLRS